MLSLSTVDVPQVNGVLDVSVMISHGLTWTILYFLLSNFLYARPSLGFSPNSHGGKTSSTAHRHAAYKLLLIPFIEIYSIRISLDYFGGWGNAFDFFGRFVTDIDFAQKEWLTPLPLKGVYIGNAFATAFFLGFFHYLTVDPMKADRVWHKVFATGISLLGVCLNLGGAMPLILVLLWKPAGLAESLFTLLYLSKKHRTPWGMSYVAVVTILNAFFRLIVEPIYLFACLRAVLPTMFSYPTHMAAVAFVAILTFLHMFWAVTAASNLYRFYTVRNKKVAEISVAYQQDMNIQ